MQMMRMIMIDNYMAPYFLTRINEYDKAMRVAYQYFLKTKNTFLYDYYFNERQNYIYNYFSERLSDEDYKNLTIY